MAASDNLSEGQFDLAKFKHLTSSADDGGEGYIDNILTGQAEHSRYAWSHTYLTMDAKHPWPKAYLKEVSDPDIPWADEHRQALHLALQQSGAVKDGMVTVRRTGKPRPGTINNVSLIRNWSGAGSMRRRATYEWEVPLHDVVGAGNINEGELFVHHPADRPIRPVAVSLPRGLK